MNASFYGFPVVVETLLSFPGIDINLKDNDGGTAFTLACSKGHSKVVNLLLFCPGIGDINMQKNHGSTALTLASQCGHHKVVKTPLFCPGIDVNIRDADGDTALPSSINYLEVSRDVDFLFRH